MISTEIELLYYFSYEHLKEPLKSISKPFSLLAEEINKSLKSSNQKEECLKLLLQAKDCAVRAKLFDEKQQSS